MANRTVEMAILWDDRTWSHGHMIELPEETFEQDMEEEARQELGAPSFGGKGFVMAALYHIVPEEEDDA